MTNIEDQSQEIFENQIEEIIKIRTNLTERTESLVEVQNEEREKILKLKLKLIELSKNLFISVLEFI